MTMDERTVQVRVKVCDGCGEDISEHAVEGKDYLTLVVKVRIPRDQKDWVHRNNPMLEASQQQTKGSMKFLHVHISDEDGNCKIKGGVFRSVIDAYLEPE